VRAAIERLPALVPGAEITAAVLLGGGEKLAGPLELGVPVVEGPTAADALAAYQSRLLASLSTQGF